LIFKPVTMNPYLTKEKRKKMDTKNFILMLTDAVQMLLGNGCSVSTKDVIKDNGLTLTGIIIHKKGRNICPTTYINQFYDLYEAGVPVDAIAEKIIRLDKEYDIPCPYDVSAIDDYKKIKDRVIFQLVNTGRNAALLETIPSVKFLDFSIILKIYFDDFPAGDAIATITHKMLDSWKVSADTVYTDALANTPVLQECSLKGMSETLVELLGIDDGITESAEPDGMYVLTNIQRLHGCGCILYPHVLEDFAEKIGMGFYILPSSRHEVILTSEYGKDPHSLTQIVRDINRTQVAQEDFLSDNVYHFSKETREITIIQ